MRNFPSEIVNITTAKACRMSKEKGSKLCSRMTSLLKHISKYIFKKKT